MATIRFDPIGVGKFPPDKVPLRQSQLTGEILGRNRLNPKMTMNEVMEQTETFIFHIRKNM